MSELDRSQMAKELWQDPEFRERNLAARRRAYDKEMKRRVLAAMRGNEK